MASVYLAETEVLPGVKRKVALKLLHRGGPGFDPEGVVEQLIEEVRVAAAVQHPNVVPVLEIEQHETGVYLVMEYVPGDSLAGLLDRAQRNGERIPLSILGRILADTLSGLHAAHELKGVDGVPLQLVHRDVSPQNILVGIDGISRLTDFGIAKTSASSMTGSGILKGKLRYMAPEQALGKPLDRRCDIWATGVVAWEALAGQRLHPQQVDVQILLSVITRPPPPVRSVCEDLPETIETLICNALQVDAEQRYSTAAEFRSALLGAWRSSGGVADYEVVSLYVRDLISRTTPTPDVEKARSSA
jgi:serine/threonine-protein kinase